MLLSFSSLVCKLIADLQLIRAIVKEHDTTRQTVNFESTALIGMWHDEEPNRTDHLKSSSLDYPITPTMILEFIQKNRQFFYNENSTEIVFNENHVGKTSDDFSPLRIENTISKIKDDISIYEFDDEYSEAELLYAIIVNK